MLVPMNDVFQKIIAREIPAEILYEDEHTLAFLDNSPNVPGHTLVIPKKHIENIFDADDETLAHVMHTVRLLAPAVRDAVGAKGVHINSNHGEAAGQIVFHLHFHIIPRHKRDEFEFWPQTPGVKSELAETGKKIREQLT